MEGWHRDRSRRRQCAGSLLLGVFEAFCARGTGRIYRYLFDDKVVAMDLCIEDAGVLVILKTTYDET